MRSKKYGNPEKQTVGGAVVSFLLRPCAFLGLVVFSKRESIYPTFTSYRNWNGHSIASQGHPEKKLARKFLHSYGPATVGGFADWLGSSYTQAQRIWQTVIDEIEPVSLFCQLRYILSDDMGLLLSPPQAERKVHLLGSHDPYLGLQDRDLIVDSVDSVESRARHKQIWHTVTNPGVVLWQGNAAGIWHSRKKGKELEIEVTLWHDEKTIKRETQDLAEEYALFQQIKLARLTFNSAQ